MQESGVYTTASRAGVGGHQAPSHGHATGVEPRHHKVTAANVTGPHNVAPGPSTQAQPLQKEGFSVSHIPAPL